MDIFISYAREDSKEANRLYQALSGIPRVTPWLDSKKLLPGVKWKLAIMDALKECDLFILLLSSNSVNKKGFVQREIVEALEKSKELPPDRIFLIPARLDDCNPKHSELHDLHWVDLYPNWEEGIRSILNVVELHLGDPIRIPASDDDIVIEVINSQSGFLNRLNERGELRAVDAMEIEFIDFDFSEHDFSGSNFVRCSFNSCKFDKALLRGVNFEGAIFNNCSIKSADLWGVNFWGAYIQGLKGLKTALIQQTNFFGARSTSEQKQIINSSLSLSLGDYGAFADYFRNILDDKEFANAFPWYNHRYFRIMFGKNNGNALRSSQN